MKIINRLGFLLLIALMCACATHNHLERKTTADIRYDRNQPNEIHFEMVVNVPVEILFEKFSDIHLLPQMFHVRSVQIAEGAAEKNGVGAIRRITLFPLLLYAQEEITAFKRYSLIEYQTIAAPTLKSHYARMQFRSLGENKSQLDYRFYLDTHAVVQSLAHAVLRYNLYRGLKNVKQQLESANKKT